MATKKSWKHLSEQEFKIVKALQDAGLLIGNTSKATGRSWGTIQNIYQSDTIAAYHQLNIDKRSNEKPAEAEVEQPLPEEAPQPHATITTALYERSIIAQERQANALEALVQAWNSSPAKKKLF